MVANNVPTSSTTNIGLMGSGGGGGVSGGGYGGESSMWAIPNTTNTSAAAAALFRGSISSGLHFMNFPAPMALLPTAQQIGLGTSGGGGGIGEGHMGFLASLGGYRPIAALPGVGGGGGGGGSSEQSSHGGGGRGGNDTMTGTSSS
ncbi:hypothetical protein QJS10_CPB18g01352 [Acorus calamus]|uniref:Uncharacterized protein n=1 Tax=Acorus calamus TaxID=4465 RepID=A0AAV9CM54_ACOCL|nr:hypothetical protein QJS10_CPB18g01352 [Acorus calamus]